MRCTFLQGYKAGLELEAVRIQLEHLQQTAAAQSKQLSAYLKHRAKAQAAAGQQQQAKHALYAWQRQALRQQEAAWAWRGLAGSLLHPYPDSQTCGRQYSPRNSTRFQPKCTVGETQEGTFSGEPSWEGAAGSAAALCAAQAAGMQTCSVMCDLCFGCMTVQGTSSRSYYMKRLLQRRRTPQGSCRAAVAEGKLLVAALKAWHMTARLEGKARAVGEVGAGMCWTLTLCMRWLELGMDGGTAHVQTQYM